MASTARVAGGPAGTGCRPRSRRRTGAAPAEVYGAAKARAHVPGQRRTRQRGGGPHERRRAHAGEPAQPRDVREPDQRRAVVVRAAGATAVLVSTTPRSWSRCASAQPREIDATPVVADGDDRSGDAERRGQRAEVGDPLRQRPRRVGALGAAHAQVVGGDDPPAGRRLGQQAAPQVGPGGVAVDAEQRADGVGGAVVQDVPGARTPAASGTVTSGTRPGRVPGGPARRAAPAVTTRSRDRRR